MTSSWSAWRAAHPEYRARQSVLRNARRARQGRGDRSAEYAQRRERRQVASADHGTITTDHPLLATARSIAGRFVRPDRRSVLHRPTYEDAVGEVIVALIGGGDAAAAARHSVRAERSWGYRTRPLTDVAEIRSPGLGLLMIRLVAQLDGSGTAAFDCGPATTAMGVDRASGGSLRPSIRVVRTRMGVPRGPTDPWDWKRALDGFDGAMEREGLRPIPSRIVDGGDLHDLHDLLVEKRRGVLLAIDYGTVARLAPRLWSSTSFRGNHAVLVNGGREHEGRDEGRVFDPLADGRSIGGKRMVRGPRWWLWSLIRAAAGNIKDRDGEPIYPGRDRWLGVVVRQAAPIQKPEPPEPEPEPPEPPTPDDRLTDALDALERHIAGLQDAYELVRTAAGEDSDSSDEPDEGIAGREA